MTTPTGLLEWGQSGNYNAIDDRTALTALAAGRSPGLVGAAPTLTPQSGLVIAIGPWYAIVNCGDGTRAVIGSRTTQTISETAGGGSSRTDVIWADINVDGGSWSASIITQAAAAARATGVALGTIIVPAGAATSAAMTLTPGAVAASGSYSTVDFTARTVTQQSFNDLSGTFTIPAGEAQVGDAYEIELYGRGTWPTGTAQQLQVQPNLGTGAAVLYAAAYFGTGNTFRFHWIARMIIVSIGASGSYFPNMLGELSGNGALNPAGAGNQQTSGMYQSDYTPNPLDLTVNQAFKIQAKWLGPNGTLTTTAAYYRRRGIGS